MIPRILLSLRRRLVRGGPLAIVEFIFIAAAMIAIVLFVLAMLVLLIDHWLLHPPV